MRFIIFFTNQWSDQNFFPRSLIQTIKRFTLEKFKGTVQRDFWPPVFSLFEPAWSTDQWVKIFSNLVKFSPSYSNFSGYITELSHSPRSIILWGVMWLSRFYLKGQSNKKGYILYFCKKVIEPNFLYSPQYCVILRGVSFFDAKCRPIGQWPRLVWMMKISLDCPFQWRIVLHYFNNLQTFRFTTWQNCVFLHLLRTQKSITNR